MWFILAIISTFFLVRLLYRPLPFKNPDLNTIFRPLKWVIVFPFELLVTSFLWYMALHGV